MKVLHLALFFLLPTLFSTTYGAEPQTEPIAGRDYETIVQKRQTSTGDKITVAELFWYGCPHCYEFEPYVEEWLISKPADVEFVRIPVIFNKSWAAHAKAYYTAEALGVVDGIHQPMLDAMHKKKMKLKDEDSLAKFFATQGVDESDFRGTFSSFIVDGKVRQAQHLTRQYGIMGVPAIVVNGKYRSSAKQAGGYPALLKVTDQLIEKERAAMAGASR